MEKILKTGEVTANEVKTDGEKDTTLDYTRPVTVSIFTPLTGKRKNMTITQTGEVVAADESNTDGERDTNIDYTQYVPISVFNPFTGKRKSI